MATKKKSKKQKTIKVYELDFGDTNFISHNYSDIAAWIEGDISGADVGETFEYVITVKQMTERKYKSLPDWS